jgi:hypothetical protein
MATFIMMLGSSIVGWNINWPLKDPDFFWMFVGLITWFVGLCVMLAERKKR